MQNLAPIPLIQNPGNRAIAFRDGHAISTNTFLHHSLNLAQQLPESQYAINLCEDRYHFLVAFAAILIKQQTNLLPPSHTAKTIQQISRQYSDCYCLLDHEFVELDLPKHRFALDFDHCVETAIDAPAIAYEHMACIAFTSGSTGAPNANPKTWGRIVTVTQLIQNAFAIRKDQPLSIVATVPAQHMYGLETSVLLPLVSGSCTYAGRPFFPEDIRQTLTSVDGPKVLVTTPIHLRACVEANLQWPQVDFIISATAPLPVELAEKAEKAFNTRVLEIFGCTEFGSLANRLTVDGDVWRLFDGLWLSESNGDYFVNAEFLSAPVALSDNIDIVAPNRFRLLGRKSDIVNIAGKRASLADLNLKLLAIPGIKDGVIFYPEEKSEYINRLVAFVVAPNLEEQQILRELKQHFDAAFLPRPIYLIDSLPREKTGKLPRKSLLALLRQYKAEQYKPKVLNLEANN